jgi:hypothetical protein
MKAIITSQRIVSIYENSILDENISTHYADLANY